VKAACLLGSWTFFSPFIEKRFSATLAINEFCGFKRIVPIGGGEFESFVTHLDRVVPIKTQSRLGLTEVELH
jgi:hypothetical protein